MKVTVTIRCSECAAITTVNVIGGWDIKHVDHVCAIKKAPATDPAAFQMVFDPPRGIY